MKDLMQQEALDEMQMNIQQIVSILSKSYNSSSLLAKNLQKRTKMSSVWEVVDDYESDSDLKH